MKKIKVYILSLLIIFGVGFAGCCGSPGEGGKSEIQIQKNTTGQQLLDIQKAHKEGAITDKEYEREKKKIIEGN